MEVAAVTAASAVKVVMRRRIQKRTKNNMIMVVTCIVAFFALPLFLMYVDGDTTKRFGMTEFLVLIFWPIAGVGIGAYYAMAVKKFQKWIIYPILTVLFLIITNIICPQVNFGLSFLCLVFELAGFGMIYFWSKM